MIGWLISLVLAYSLGGLLALSGVVLSLLFTGSAMATTAIGTLIPVLSDAGEMRTRFGTYLLAAGAVGEFGPILLITLVFSTKGAAENAVILAAFVVVAVAAALMAVRGVGRGWGLLDRSLATSGQFAVRIAVLMVFALGALADSLGLDLLLGGFVAGVIARVALQGHEVEVLESKLTAVGYGFLIPFFFVVSGVNFDLTALTSHPIHLLELPLFLALFLIVRGTPAMVLYRGVLGFRDRAALAVFSATALPLIVAITTIAVTGGAHALIHRRRPRGRWHPVDRDLPRDRPAAASRNPQGRADCGGRTATYPSNASGDLTPDAVQVDSRQLRLGQECARPAVLPPRGIAQEITRDHQHRRSAVFAGEQRAQIEAGAVGQAYVEQHCVGPQVLDSGEARRSSVRLPHDVVAAALEQFTRGAPERNGVVHDQDAEPLRGDRSSVTGGLGLALTAEEQPARESDPGCSARDALHLLLERRYAGRPERSAGHENPPAVGTPEAGGHGGTHPDAALGHLTQHVCHIHRRPEGRRLEREAHPLRAGRLRVG